MLVVRASRLTATFRIVTPMFLGGAGHEVTRIRETSIKGAICFWWRTLVFSRLVADCGGDHTRALQELKEREKKLFGGPKGQSGLLIKVANADLRILKSGKFLGRDGNETTARPANHEQQQTWERNSVAGTGARYLGYGVIGAFGQVTGQLKRSCVLPGGSFQVRFAFRRSNSAQDIQDNDEIVRAIKLFGLLGGLGARVRRGYGSVTLLELEGDGLCEEIEWKVPADGSEFKTALKDLLAGNADLTQSGGDWPITAFAPESQCFVTKSTKSNGLAMLNEIGEAFQLYRAWGYRANPIDWLMVNAQRSLKNFEEDHDWFRNEGGFCTSHPNFVPERTAFGLPHKYDDDFIVTGTESIDRRASPLTIHIHQGGDNALGVMTLFPTQFLPTGNVQAHGNAKSYDFAAQGLPVLTYFLTGNPADRVMADGSTKAFAGSFASKLTPVLP